jgi:hypothetical protein
MGSADSRAVSTEDRYNFPAKTRTLRKRSKVPSSEMMRQWPSYGHAEGGDSAAQRPQHAGDGRHCRGGIKDKFR